LTPCRKPANSPGHVDTRRGAGKRCADEGSSGHAVRAERQPPAGITDAETIHPSPCCDAGAELYESPSGTAGASRCEPDSTSLVATAELESSANIVLTIKYRQFTPKSFVVRATKF
jgi:hypothetical protein